MSMKLNATEYHHSMYHAKMNETKYLVHHSHLSQDILHHILNEQLSLTP